MLVVLEKDAEQTGRAAAGMVARAIQKNPSLRLGLATGSTTLPFYRELVRRHREEQLDFSRVVTFNLDEYLGLAPEHPQSFRFFMQNCFFQFVNVAPENIHVPDGTIRGKYDEYCASYEQAISEAGGIDLQILGIGRNGHIGFNEPMSSLGSRTRLKVLNQETLDDNRKFFAPGEAMPQCSITVGIGTIMDSQRILILAAGESKADAVVKSIEGPVTSAVPASVLQLHPEVTFILDESAASRLA